MGTAGLRGGGHRGAQRGHRHARCAQRSPSEALSPSVGPRWDRPTAISSDVWLRPKLHRSAGPPQSVSEYIKPITG
ncbi:hypothetical protein TUSST3_31250 [Streptomyces sp. TUS-ST3]|nr:hypothetical protein TUSST3_31250 [Streptomyces sp. TUS-ST3]